MKKSILKYYVLILTIGMFCRLFFGVYVHDEFNDKVLFFKHRPTWKWTFYSPFGMSDLTMDDLTEEEQKEQILFFEFVRDQGLSR